MGLNSGDNVLVKRDRIVFIDFGESALREEGEDNDAWAEAVRMYGDAVAIRNVPLRGRWGLGA